VYSGGVKFRVRRTNASAFYNHIPQYAVCLTLNFTPPHVPREKEREWDGRERERERRESMSHTPQICDQSPKTTNKSSFIENYWNRRKITRKLHIQTEREREREREREKEHVTVQCMVTSNVAGYVLKSNPKETHHAFMDTLTSNPPKNLYINFCGHFKYGVIFPQLHNFLLAPHCTMPSLPCPTEHAPRSHTWKTKKSKKKIRLYNIPHEIQRGIGVRLAAHQIHPHPQT